MNDDMSALKFERLTEAEQREIHNAAKTNALKINPVYIYSPDGC